MTDSRLVYTSNSDGAHGEVVTIGHYLPQSFYQQDRQVFLVEPNLLGDLDEDATFTDPESPYWRNSNFMLEQLDNRVFDMVAALANMTTRDPYVDVNPNPWALRLVRSEVPGYETAIIAYIDPSIVDDAITTIGHHLASLASDTAIVNTVQIGAGSATAYPRSQSEAREWHEYQLSLDWMDDV